MASTLFFCGDFGTAVGSPETRGTTSVTGLTNISFKNTDDANTDFNSSVISAGSLSFDKYVFGLWSGSFNQISNVKWNHVSGVLGGGLQFVFGVSGSGFYRTPATTSNARFNHDLTATGLVSTGLAVLVGTGAPNREGKATSTTTSPAFSEFIGGQLVTTAAASPGQTTVYHFALSWAES